MMPVAQRRLMFTAVGVFVLVGMVVGVFVVKAGWLRPTEPLVVDDKPQVKAAAEPGSKEQEAVRKWLAENTDTGKWEEVRWWKPKDIQRRDTPAGTKPSRLIRLKYRTEGPDGMALQNDIFEIRNGKVDYYKFDFNHYADQFPD